ncbi:MAG: nucleotidyltransferase family protein, partial [Gemmatimonadota bacterium]|nr:nucleotidyltransferase family protein [Gemmatimonadota bacterium]
MQAILPLAGKGTRLRPHTHTRPKPLLRVANRPVLDRVIDLLAEAGVDEIIGVMGHLAGDIEAHLAEFHAGLKFTPVEQRQQLGTADAIRLARPHVAGPVLIVFVDTLFEADLGLITARPDADGIIWAKEVEDYQRFGVIVQDDEG